MLCFLYIVEQQDGVQNKCPNKDNKVYLIMSYQKVLIKNIRDLPPKVTELSMCYIWQILQNQNRVSFKPRNSYIIFMNKLSVLLLTYWKK